MSANFTPAMPSLKRRTCLSSLGISLFGSMVFRPFSALAAPVQLPASQSLLDEIYKASKSKDPLIVMVSLAGCPYCKMARESYLGPMQKQGFPIVQVDMKSDLPVKGFKGQLQTHDQLVKQWRVSVAPTLIFLGPQGQELVDRMEGGYLPDFYGAYLEERIAKARKILRNET